MPPHALALFAVLAVACSDDTTTDDTATDDTSTTTETDPGPFGGRDEVLIFHGHGGVGPEGAWGYVTHSDTIALLEPEGLTVDQRDDWPGTVSAVRLVILPMPGFTSEETFSSGEVGDLEDVMAEGGVVAVQGENGGTMGADVINTLMEDLGASMRIGGSSESFPAGGSDHPLADGVDDLGTLAPGSLAVDDDDCLYATSGGSCLAAARSMGSGYLVLMPDAQILELYESWDDQGLDNSAFLWNLTRLAWELGEGPPETE